MGIGRVVRKVLSEQVESELMNDESSKGGRSISVEGAGSTKVLRQELDRHPGDTQKTSMARSYWAGENEVE